MLLTIIKDGISIYNKTLKDNHKDVVFMTTKISEYDYMYPDKYYNKDINMELDEEDNETVRVLSLNIKLKLPYKILKVFGWKEKVNE